MRAEQSRGNCFRVSIKGKSHITKWGWQLRKNNDREVAAGYAGRVFSAYRGWPYSREAAGVNVRQAVGGICYPGNCEYRGVRVWMEGEC